MAYLFGRTLPLFVLAAAGLSAETLVLENFTLIDGSGAKPVPNAALVVTDGRIQYAGPKGRARAPKEAQRVDLSGKFVMPGIINLHSHLGNVKGLVQDPANFTRENVESNLKTLAHYGVTATVSMGSDADLIYEIRAEQRAGRPTMTRVFTAGRGFTGKGGYPTQAPGMKGVPYEVSTVEEIERAVKELASKRVDLVKVWVDDHLGKEEKIPLHLTRAIIDNAHKHGLKVVAHIFYLEDAKKLVEAGLDGLGHSVRDKPVDDELIRLMKQKGAWQAACTFAREVSVFAYAKTAPFLDDPFFQRAATPEIIATLKSADYQKRIQADPDLPLYPGFLETAKKNLKRLADGGVRYGFGTDSGPPARFFGYFEHMEMEQMAEAGLTPNEIIRAATASSAEFLGAGADIGTLQKGRWADLIVLDKNPLEDIRNTRTIHSVYIAGHKVR
jgi:imidazolonepropionase-like amidohydrolase